MVLELGNALAAGGQRNPETVGAGREAARVDHGDVQAQRHQVDSIMQKVTKEELAAMDGESNRCATELADARVDVLGYACLVAIMSMGNGYHRVSEQRLQGRIAAAGGPAPVVTSAGALVDGIKAVGAEGVDTRALHEAADAPGDDAIVASACVPMPSLASVQIIENRTGLPVLSSSVSTTYRMLKKLGLKTEAPGFGALLSGKY